MAKGSTDKKRKAGQKKARKGPSALEWFCGALGAIITLGLLGFITAEALQPGIDLPPILKVEPVQLVRGPSGYVLVIDVANNSGQTASGVSVEGTLDEGGEELESSNATLNYLPAHSERRAGLIFTHDPRAYHLEVRATGYEEP